MQSEWKCAVPTDFAVHMLQFWVGKIEALSKLWRDDHDPCWPSPGSLARNGLIKNSENLVSASFLSCPNPYRTGKTVRQSFPKGIECHGSQGSADARLGPADQFAHSSDPSPGFVLPIHVLE